MSKNTCVNVIITHENPYNKHVDVVMITLTHVFFDIYVFIIRVFMGNDNVDTCIFRHLRVYYKGCVNVIITYENPNNKHEDVEKYMCQPYHCS
jgi:hypothetical protein